MMLVKYMLFAHKKTPTLKHRYMGISMISIQNMWFSMHLDEPFRVKNGNVNMVGHSMILENFTSYSALCPVL